VSETKAGRSLAKGLLAGLVAGLVATAAKSCVEAVFPPRVHGEPEPPEALAEKIAGHRLDRKTKASAGRAIHWGFGAAVGAAYGAVAEFYPAVTAKEGATFGLTLMSLTHETSLPAMELAEPAEAQSFRERSSEATSHVVYGLVAERVRSLVRGML
jgi:putative membrane protein